MKRVPRDREEGHRQVKTVLPVRPLQTKLFGFDSCFQYWKFNIQVTPSCFVFPDGTGPALLSTMIAGLPYNRAHELQYQPGEMRLNVTFDTTLAILKNKNREEYKSAITTG